MGLEIEAVYADGVLRLSRPLPLGEGQKVTITIHPPGGRVKKSCGMLPWTGSAEELDRFLTDPDEGRMHGE